MVILIAYLISGVIFGCITRYVATSKGYDSGFAWGFFLGLIGLLVVGFRPNISETSYAGRSSGAMEGYRMSSSSQMESYTHTPDRTPWHCVCGTENAGSLDYCLNCRRTREEGTMKKVNCPHCGASNKEANEMCFACGKPMKEEKQEKLTAAPVPEAEKTDGVEVLKKLAELHAQGILTDEEFAQKKQEILGKI